MRLLFAALASFCLVIILFSCQSPGDRSGQANADSTYTLTGKIEGVDSGWALLRHRQAQGSNIDSVRIDHGQFVFKGRAPQPEFCTFGYAQGSNKDYYFSFFLQNGKLTLNGSKNALTDTKVTFTGSPVEEEFQRFQQSQQPLDSIEEMDSRVYSAASKAKDQRAMDSLQKVFEDLDRKQKQSIRDYSKAHPGSYVSAFEVYSNFIYNPDAVELDSLYKGLDSVIRVSWFGNKLREAVNSAKLTAVGQPAPEFTQNTADGKPVALSSFKGKYTLVDFWASWCGPCRAENPNVVKTWHKYHSKGFDILGVSLDSKKDKWEEAVKKDGHAWTQVSDLKGWDNSVAVMYGIKGIPMNYLLDKDGKIIGKGLRGEDLEKELDASMK